ncbi:MAG: hypothetical protein HC910_03670 [Spirulinaceae cyanobacterium SM2_1_0]|nr:hypothetical protein [Spirulinaceae cyanobacterium SM2_1_0]
MFLSELQPLSQEFLQQPIAFVGGFFAGAFKLSLEEDPLKNWLSQQGITPTGSPPPTDNSHNGGPQSIAID